jgi:type II secretory pathway pseudopilin PulG
MKRAHALRECASAAGKPDAFTFVEVFAAMVFLAILVPAIVQGLSIANRASVIAQRGAIAGQLAENKINEVKLAVLSGSTSESRGDFGPDWPGYRWEMNQDTWNQDGSNTMTQLSVQVYYPVQGSERSVTLDTLVSGTSQGASL